MKARKTRLLFILVACTTSTVFILFMTNQKVDNDSFKLIPINEINETDQWIVLAGDSNMKFVWHRILDTFRFLYHKQIKSTLVSEGYDPNVNKWVDRDMIFYFKNNAQLRISLKFLHGDVSEFYRINNTWSDIRLCDTSCDYTEPPSKQHEDFTYTTKPDVLWITHGLWALKSDLTEQGTNCYGNSNFTEYIFAVSKYLASMKKDINVIWQTNPSISWHPNIKKSQVKSDYLCQKKLSFEYKIPIFDVFGYTDKNCHKRMKGYHFDNVTQQYIIQHLFDKLFISSKQISGF